MKAEIEWKIDIEIFKSISCWFSEAEFRLKKKKLVNYTFVSAQKLMTAHSKAPYSNLKTLLTVSQMDGNKSWGLAFGWHIYSLGK